jgi:hypothetical protein
MNINMPSAQVALTSRRSTKGAPYSHHRTNGTTKVWECLTACKALSHANAKGKGIDSKGWAFRMLSFSKREEKK